MPPDAPPAAGQSFSLNDFRLAASEEEYKKAIAVIKDYIVAGDTYQVNFTNRYRFRFEGSPAACYCALRGTQRVGYGAFINTGESSLLSFSPELFFRLEEGRLITRPMKGTAPRGRNIAEDEELTAWLSHDAKNRSENLMIVDLLRNDLGRIAETGSVAVKEMFSVEKYETLLQMTSTIECTLSGSPPFYDIFRSLFPSGSVTGAPKIRTMKIIHELEGRPRGIYTGAIGYFSPNRNAAFNIAIRTLVLNGLKGEMGIGSGIVFDSTPQEEYDECILKAKFLTELREPFQLIESLFWNGGYRLLAEHLQRLESSARYFDFVYPDSIILQALARNESTLAPGSPYKVRLLLRSDGTMTVENQLVPDAPGGGLVLLSTSRTSSADSFLYHKTTRRQLYDAEFSMACTAGFDDVVFRNERDEVTEGAISNVFIQDKEGRLYTPPLSSGLLPGICRADILRNTPGAAEKILRVGDLLSAKALFICNDVRGMRKVRLVTT